jgi:hypothetical protein
MRQFTLVLLSLILTSSALASDVPGLVPLDLQLRDILGLIAFGALGGMVFWHLRR